MSEPTPYDVVAYPGLAFEQTHPASLAVIAALHGMQPADPETARVLELGCGGAENLIPMACFNPRARFTGIDLSGEAIGRARRQAERLKLDNIDLRQLDIMQADAGLGRFDYIIAHGVYSWVPPAVRERIMAVFRAHLQPQGVAFVSYNCFPGWRMHDMAREIMLRAAEGLSEAGDVVRVAKAALRRIVEASDETTLYGTLMRHEMARVTAKGDSVLFHDDLNPGATAFHFRDVAAAAQRHGLQFMAETPFPTRLRGKLAGAQALLDAFPEDRLIEREQLHDDIVGRSFRETLLVHEEVRLERRLEPAALRPFWIAGNIEPGEEGADPLEPGISQFVFDAGVKLKLDHRLSKAALKLLGEAWPGAMRFDALQAAALDALGEAAGPVRANLAEESAGLLQALFSLFVAGQIELRLGPPPVQATPPERPLAFPLARMQAETGMANNPRHQVVALDDPKVQRFLRLLDGTRDIDGLVAALNAEPGSEPVGREQVVQNLRIVTRLSLLAP